MKRYLFAIILGLGGCAILISLGLWQLDRLGQKQAAIAAIEARISTAPAPLPANPTPEADKYLTVEASGVLDGVIRIYTSRKDIGAGYRIIQAFETDGRRVMVDRGFLPIESHSDVNGPTVATVIGTLHWPDETTSWTPAPNIETNVWFARDVAAMAEALGTEPVLIVARSLEPDSFTARPLPVSTADISNDHLEYVITWFSLALIWAGMTVYLLWRIKRRTA